MFFKLFASKKVFAAACRYYRNLWESCEMVEFERENPYNNYCRLSGVINRVKYQVHVNDTTIADRYNRYNKTNRDNNDELIRVFAVACVCADFGYFYKDFAHLAKNLVLNA